MKYLINIIVLIVLTNPLLSQQENLKDFKNLKKMYNDMAFESIINSEINKFLNANRYHKGDIYHIYAQTYEALNKDDKAFEYYIEAKKNYKSEDKPDKVAQINLSLYDLIDSKKNLDIDKSIFIKELKAHAQATGSKKWFMSYYHLMGVDNFNTKAKDSAKVYFLKAIQLAKEIDSLRAEYKMNTNLGALYLVEYKMPDSAVYFYEKAIKQSLVDKNYPEKENDLFALYNNLGNAYRDQQQYEEANRYYQKAEKIDLKLFNSLSKRILFNNMEVNYYYMEDFKNAYNYLYKYDSINEIINLKEQNTSIKDIEEKYQNQKLRADNLESEAKRSQNRNIALALGGSLILGTIIAILVYKNRQRQQEIELQEQELRTQQLATQLKEQEIISINALIEGQEKERLIIANDLHDDLGSLMATIKMHFSAFKDKDTKNLFDRTNTLIENAYQKIRNIAHAKNSGVLAKQGLYEAILKMADNVSKSKQININVHENGLDQRLENSVELTIFRVVQELIANVIKHAQATEVDIHLNQTKDNLNIMVEDNGVGFDTKFNANNREGIGLINIEKRIESLGGTVVIESQKNSGTSVIIDMPL